tara:strand:+ start:296 stop:472 length:177 start_codon:yes stop_codon:yes gene_type:complete
VVQKLNPGIDDIDPVNGDPSINPVIASPHPNRCGSSAMMHAIKTNDFLKAIPAANLFS